MHTSHTQARTHLLAHSYTHTHTHTHTHTRTRTRTQANKPKAPPPPPPPPRRDEETEKEKALLKKQLEVCVQTAFIVFHSHVHRHTHTSNTAIHSPRITPAQQCPNSHPIKPSLLPTARGCERGCTTSSLLPISHHLLRDRNSTSHFTCIPR